MWLSGTPSGLGFWPVADNEVRIAISRVVGDVTLLGGNTATEIKAVVSRVVGDVTALAQTINGVQVAISNVLGPVRALVTHEGDEWSDADLPCPLLRPWTYRKNAGIIRTPMLSGQPRQRKLHTDGRRYGTVEVRLKENQIYDAEDFIASKGFDWFTMSLATEDNTSTTAEPHTLRIINNPEVRSAVGDGLQLLISVELA